MGVEFPSQGDKLSASSSVSWPRFAMEILRGEIFLGKEQKARIPCR
jgi:hypothetical protein